MELKERVKLRKPNSSDNLVDEIILTTQERILLRAGIFLANDESFPPSLNSIVVEVATAMLNQAEIEHEGIVSESAEGWSLNFLDDLLKPYEVELKNYKKNLDEQKGKAGKVRFI